MMREKDLKETGLADMAFKVESDHEVQMARAELYKVAKYAIKMHEMLKGVEEREGLEGWVQSKITKAADYMGSVYHHMDYEQKFDEVSESRKAISEKEKMKVTKADKDLNTKAYQELQKGNPRYEYDKDAVKDKKEDKKKTPESYVDYLQAKLNEANGVCPDCGNPSYTTLPEEKQKGVDGKVCWKGYKRMGTKKKGGKTVDNCVKM